MDADKLIDALVVIVLIGLAWFGMVWGWRALRRRQAGLGPVATPPSELGAVVLTDDLFYVATTRSDKPLERLAVKGLGYRGRAGLTVATAGVVLDIAGTPSAFIPRDAVRGAGRATWTIDRAVSGDGLVFVRWMLPAVDEPVEVDSYFRPTDPAALVAALDTLVPTTAPSKDAA